MAPQNYYLLLNPCAHKHEKSILSCLKYQTEQRVRACFPGMQESSLQFPTYAVTMRRDIEDAAKDLMSDVLIT